MINSTHLVTLRSRLSIGIGDVEGHDLPNSVAKSGEVGSDEAGVTSDDGRSLRKQRLGEDEIDLDSVHDPTRVLFHLGATHFELGKKRSSRSRVRDLNVVRSSTGLEGELSSR